MSCRGIEGKRACTVSGLRGVCARCVVGVVSGVMLGAGTLLLLRMVVQLPSSLLLCILVSGSSRVLLLWIRFGDVFVFTEYRGHIRGYISSVVDRQKQSLFVNKGVINCVRVCICIRFSRQCEMRPCCDTRYSTMCAIFQSSL